MSAPHGLELSPHDRIAAAAREMLSALGYDPDADDLRDTPQRVAGYWSEVLLAEPFSFTTFKNPGTDEMVVQANIEFFSVCEHHMVPFFGTACVGYIPGARIVGLSKLARAVQMYAKGLQTQERITRQVADLLNAKLEPKGVGVVLRARHLCMEMRGVRTREAVTTTSFTSGAFRENAATRAEFLKLAHA